MDGHRDCRSSSPYPRFLPKRLVDVGSPDKDSSIKLIETADLHMINGPRQYAVLSHCWGSKTIIVTSISNVDHHKKTIPALELSKTFRDAIHTVRELGLQYIWIDSLCIIQAGNTSNETGNRC